jgi:cobalamin biosynthesis Mg chelatase CobN
VVESFEAANSESLKAQAARRMREQVAALNLRAELEASMADVLEVRGIGFEDADDDLLAHEIGHYLTKLQEKFMPHGLHIFGQDWSAESLKLMADSMGQVAGGYDAPSPPSSPPRRAWKWKACSPAWTGASWPGQGQRPAALARGPAHRAQLPRRRWRPPAHPAGLRPRRPPRRQATARPRKAGAAPTATR